jgi:hypothetical protein
LTFKFKIGYLVIINLSAKMLEVYEKHLQNHHSIPALKKQYYLLEPHGAGHVNPPASPAVFLEIYCRQYPTPSDYRARQRRQSGFIIGGNAGS